MWNVLHYLPLLGVKWVAVSLICETSRRRRRKKSCCVLVSRTHWAHLHDRRWQSSWITDLQAPSRHCHTGTVQPLLAYVDTTSAGVRLPMARTHFHTLAAIQLRYDSNLKSRLTKIWHHKSTRASMMQCSYVSGKLVVVYEDIMIVFLLGREKLWLMMCAE